jgi:hypothetical protein
MLAFCCCRAAAAAAAADDDDDDATTYVRYSCFALQTYLAAGKRCGLSETAAGYWALHIKEDERHGRQMLEEVALPLVDM